MKTATKRKGKYMGRIVELSGTCRPTSKMRNYQKHNRDLSEGSKAKLIAKRTIMGHSVCFYENGEQIIETMSQDDMSNDEMFNSEVLRFAHASLISGVPVGDKSLTWVDASKDPCEVWIFGKTPKQFTQDAMACMQAGTLDPAIILDGKTVETMRTLTHV